MPPKRQPESQRNLDAFFGSPAGKGKGKVDVGKVKGKGTKQETTKTQRAVRSEGNGNAKAEVKGKGKVKEEGVIDLDPETDDDVVCVDSPSPVASSSKPSPTKPPPKTKLDLKPSVTSKKSTQSGKVDEKPTPRSLKRAREITPDASPLFVASTPSKRRSTTGQVLGLQSPHAKVKDEPLVKVDPSTTSTTNAPKPLNLDTDPLIFRPQEVDTTGWRNCGGRLPYEVLVESVYLPVAGTRSRLAIGRVICK
jgi:hypothetical protein